MFGSINMIVTDIDGTIVDSPKSYELNRELEDTLHRVINLGIKVGLASGRSYGHIMSHLGYIGFNSPLICNNGAVIRDDNNIYFEKLLSPDIVLKAWCLARNMHCRAEFLSDYMMYVCEFRGYRGIHVPQMGKGNYKIDLVDSNQSMNMLYNSKISKITLTVADRTQANEVCREWSSINMLLSSSTELTRSLWNFIEISPKGISKASGLKYLTKKLRIPLSEVMVFGDGDNDAGMLRMASNSFAVSNASSEAKMAAKEIIPAVYENGVGVILKERILGV